MRIIKLFWVLSYCVLSSMALSQNMFQTTIDSLNTLLKKQTDDSSRITLMLDIAWNYLQVDLMKTDSIADKAFLQSKKSDFKEGMSRSLHFKGLVLEYGGKVDSSLSFYQQALDIAIEADIPYLKMSLYNAMGMAYYKMGFYEKALQNYLNAEKLIDMVKKDGNAAGIFNNIANVFLQQGKFDKALEYHFRSLDISLKNNELSRVASSYYNIGLIYKDKKDIQKALEFLGKSLAVSEQANSLFGMSLNNQTIASIYIDKGEYEKALVFLQKSEEYKNMLNDKQGLARTYFYKSKCYSGVKDYGKGLEFGLRSLELCQKYDLRTVRRDVLYDLSDVEKNLGNFNKAYEYLLACKLLDDSLVAESNQKIFEEMQTRFDTEKKQQQIEIQQAEIKNKDLEVRQQKIVIWAFIGGFILIFLLLILVYKNFIEKKKTNKILSAKNEIIEQQNTDLLQKNEEISTQRDEIAAQRDLATNQRDIIAKQQKDIKDSIQYAFQIQSALFPTDEDLRLVLKDYFIFYRPRDIVSGDFYWVNKSGSKIIIVASDCTGHGVPGAFMSMLGIAFLNEIVGKENITDPAQILNRLRENIILAMKQHGENVKQQDGMDAVAITIDRNSGTLEFSGANNPLYIVHSPQSAVLSRQSSVGSLQSTVHSQLKTEDYRLTELKGDKMPVAIYSRMQPFTLHTVSVSDGDVIYIFSDGYADQFGGPDGKKFKYKTLKDLLLSGSGLPMTEQKDILAKTFDDWKGSNSQIDDVLIIGVKI